MDIKEYQKDVRKQFYNKLSEYCEDPDRYFNKIFELMPDAYKIPSFNELISTLSCIISLITHGKNQKKCNQLIDLLPWYKFDFHYQVTHVATPLEWAVYCNKYYIAEHLIDKHGIDPNFKNSNGKTLLHLAVRIANASDALKMVRMLLDRGADPRILAKPDRKNFPGENVLDHLPPDSLYDPKLNPKNKEVLLAHTEIREIINNRIKELNEESSKTQIASSSTEKEKTALPNRNLPGEEAEADELEEASESTPFLIPLKESTSENSPSSKLTHRAKKGESSSFFSRGHANKENNNDFRLKLKRS